MPLAFLAAALFAVHPVSAMSVNYIGGRDLLMMQMFLLASLFAYVRMRRENGSNALVWLISLGCLLLATFAKENAYVAPALVLLYEVLIRGEDPRSGAPWLKTLPFVAVILARILVVPSQNSSMLRSRFQPKLQRCTWCSLPTKLLPFSAPIPMLP